MARIWTLEQRAAQSERLKRAWTPERREKLSVVVRASWTPERRAARWTPERRAATRGKRGPNKPREGLTARWTPERRAKDAALWTSERRATYRDDLARRRAAGRYDAVAQRIAATRAQWSDARREAYREASSGKTGEQSNSYKHGHTSAAAPTKVLWSLWWAMHTRCYNPNHDSWKYYGGRGVTVCTAWLSAKYGGDPDPAGFERWLFYMGERPPGKSIDRYPDPTGNYEPGNVRWATWTEQNRNKRPR